MDDHVNQNGPYDFLINMTGEDGKTSPKSSWNRKKASGANIFQEKYPARKNLKEAIEATKILSTKAEGFTTCGGT